jgi:SAM-dependent methyltransferase
MRPSPSSTAAFDFAEYARRYRDGEWRAKIFRDMILADARNFSSPRFLDIGCGRGFDSDERLQRELAGASAAYVGVEPDPDIAMLDVFSQVHRTTLENAQLAPESIDVAFSVMVLEHLDDPAAFWASLHRCLRKGGIAWNFTVDARHWFARNSALIARLGLKDRYLTLLKGRRGADRYENYPVRYLCNTPDDVRKHAAEFEQVDVYSLSRVGQVDYYLPRVTQPFAHWLDRRDVRSGAPGMVLVVRAVK